MKDQINELTRGELLSLLQQYDQYIQQANDEDKYRDGWFPVCIEEFLGSEAQDRVDNSVGPCKVVVALEPFGKWRLLLASEDTRVIVVDRRRGVERSSDRVLDHQDELACQPGCKLHEALSDELSTELQNSEVSPEEINQALLTN